MNLLYNQCQSLVDHSLPPISNLSNLLAFLYHEIENINWIGFYLIDHDLQSCILGPFQGKFACTKIPFGKGVVGQCALEQKTINVQDVHLFPGHIACDCASKSELVIPLFYNQELIAILDIDSPIYHRFNSQLESFFISISDLFPHLLDHCSFLK